MDSKYIFIIVASLFFLVQSCDPIDEPGHWQGYGFCNKSNDTIKVLHIAGFIYISAEDSTSYYLPPQKEALQYEDWGDDDAYYVQNLKFNRTYDTIKIFRADTLIKLWHGPLTESQTSLHTPYEIGDWERIEKKDTTILRFTITDKDFE